jgi:hypothetical protein
MLAPAIVAGLVVAGVASWSGAAPAIFSADAVRSGSVDCVGALAPGTYHDVKVPSGKTCTIDNTDVIKHDVHVGMNATLNDAGASIGHNLDAEKGSQLNIGPSSGYSGTNATIGHDLNADKANSVQIVSTKIGHDLLVVNSQGSVSITNNSIGHDLHVQGNSGSTTVTGNSVGHDADCKDNAGFLGGGNTAGHADSCN